MESIYFELALYGSKNLCANTDNRHLKVHSEKEPNWMQIQRKSQITCKFGGRAKVTVNWEKAKLAVNLEMKPVFQNFRHLPGSLPTTWKIPDVLGNLLQLQIDSYFVCFSELTANLALTLNLQLI